MKVWRVFACLLIVRTIMQTQYFINIEPKLPTFSLRQATELDSVQPNTCLCPCQPTNWYAEIAEIMWFTTGSHLVHWFWIVKLHLLLFSYVFLPPIPQIFFHSILNLFLYTGLYIYPSSVDVLLCASVVSILLVLGWKSSQNKPSDIHS